MSGAMVQNILQSVNLNFDLSAIEETHRFLLEHIGSNCKARLDYETLSAAAIVCEFRQVPSMGA